MTSNDWLGEYDRAIESTQEEYWAQHYLDRTYVPGDAIELRADQLEPGDFLWGPAVTVAYIEKNGEGGVSVRHFSPRAGDAHGMFTVPETDQFNVLRTKKEGA